MFHIILYEPEIPPNTGNIMRLCSNTGSQLHLIKPLGFKLDDTRMRRAGLDYREWIDVKIYNNIQECCEHLNHSRIWLVETSGKHCFSDIQYQAGDAFLFGPETRGLPENVLNSFSMTQQIYIPMKPNNRSLNLSNATAIVLYEAWRQFNYQ